MPRLTKDQLERQEQMRQEREAANFEFEVRKLAKKYVEGGSDPTTARTTARRVVFLRNKRAVKGK